LKFDKVAVVDIGGAGLKKLENVAIAMHCNLRPPYAVERCGQKSHFDPLSVIFEVNFRNSHVCGMSQRTSLHNFKIIGRPICAAELLTMRLSKAFTSVLRGSPKTA